MLSTLISVSASLKSTKRTYFLKQNMLLIFKLNVVPSKDLSLLLLLYTQI